MPCPEDRATPSPPGGGGLVPSQIQPLSLWERVAEGWLDPPQTQPLSLWERVAEGWLDPPQTQPLSLWERVAEGRLDPSQTQPLSLWERVAEGRVRAPTITLPLPFRAISDGLPEPGALTPTLSHRERASEGCETNLCEESS